jgi:hypothetical protein
VLATPPLRATLADTGDGPLPGSGFDYSAGDWRDRVAVGYGWLAVTRCHPSEFQSSSRAMPPPREVGSAAACGHDNAWVIDFCSSAVPACSVLLRA